MEDQELSQKLDRIKLPEIELSGHQRGLRLFLLEKHARENEWVEIFAPLWKGTTLASASLLILLLLFFNTSVWWPPSFALAKEIALRDSRVKSLIGRGATIKETQLADHKGYLLVKIEKDGTVAQTKQNLNTAVPPSIVAIATPSAFLVEVDFKGKKVSEIKELPFPSLFLDEADKIMVKEISRQSEKVQREIPSEAGIEDIKPSSADLKLVKKGSRVEVRPEREAIIIYKQDGKRWQGTVNMGASEIETIEFIGEEEQ